MSRSERLLSGAGASSLNMPLSVTTPIARSNVRTAGRTRSGRRRSPKKRDGSSGARYMRRVIYQPIAHGKSSEPKNYVASSGHRLPRVPGFDRDVLRLGIPARKERAQLCLRGGTRNLQRMELRGV